MGRQHSKIDKISASDFELTLFPRSFDLDPVAGFSGRVFRGRLSGRARFVIIHELEDPGAGGGQGYVHGGGGGDNLSDAGAQRGKGRILMTVIMTIMTAYEVIFTIIIHHVSEVGQRGSRSQTA